MSQQKCDMKGSFEREICYVVLLGKWMKNVRIGWGGYFVNGKI